MSSLLHSPQRLIVAGGGLILLTTVWLWRALQYSGVVSAAFQMYFGIVSMIAVGGLLLGHGIAKWYEMAGSTAGLAIGYVIGILIAVAVVLLFMSAIDPFRTPVELLTRSRTQYLYAIGVAVVAAIVVRLYDRIGRSEFMTQDLDLLN